MSVKGPKPTDDADSLTSPAWSVRIFTRTASLPDELKKKINQDLGDMAKDMQAHAREAGAIVSVSFETPKGQESFTFDWSGHRVFFGPTLFCSSTTPWAPRFITNPGGKTRRCC